MSRYGNPSIRAFLAIPAPDGVRASIVTLGGELAGRFPGARIVPAERVHLTLHFFAALAAGEVPVVEAAMEEAAAEVAPFEMGLSGTGVFPDRRRARVLWAGIGEGRDEVVRLAGLVAGGLKDRGFAVDDRPFEPHVTIARMGRSGAGCPNEVLAACDALANGAGLVDRITLFRSDLGRRGPAYTALRMARLSGPVSP